MARLDKNSLLNGVSGAIGKELVLKQYGDKTVVSKYPDMSRVKKSELQKLQQGVFAQAVAFAQGAKRDPKLRAKYLKKLKSGQSVYHAALQDFLKKANKEMRKK